MIPIVESCDAELTRLHDEIERLNFQYNKVLELRAFLLGKPIPKTKAGLVKKVKGGQ